MTETPQKTSKFKRFKKIMVVFSVSGILLLAVGYYLYAIGLSKAGARYFDQTITQIDQAQQIIIKGRFYVNNKEAYLQAKIVESNQIKFVSERLKSLNYKINYEGSKIRRRGARCACAVGGEVIIINANGQNRSFIFHGHGILTKYLTQLDIDSLGAQRFFYDDLVEMGVEFEEVK